MSLIVYLTFVVCTDVLYIRSSLLFLSYTLSLPLCTVIKLIPPPNGIDIKDSNAVYNYVKTNIKHLFFKSFLNLQTLDPIYGVDYSNF